MAIILKSFGIGILAVLLLLAPPAIVGLGVKYYGWNIKLIDIATIVHVVFLLASFAAFAWLRDQR